MRFKGKREGNFIKISEDIGVKEGGEVDLEIVKKQWWNNLKSRAILSSFITGLGIFYLIFALTGQVKKDDRLGQSELIVFATILLLNSELIERLAKLPQCQIVAACSQNLNGRAPVSLTASGAPVSLNRNPKK